MAASRMPPEVFEMILQFAPDSGLNGFKVDKRELQEDAKIIIRKNQFAPISIRSPNQLRLLNRIALAYVRSWKSSPLLCEIWMKGTEEDFSKAEVELSFLHSNAVPLIGHINRKAYRDIARTGKLLAIYRNRNRGRFPDTVALPAEGAFKGLTDLASSYYSEQIAQIQLHVYAYHDVDFDFCYWFHSFWLYVLETFPAAADLPTFVDVNLLTDEIGIQPPFPALAEQLRAGLPSNFFDEMPNNFERLDLSVNGGAFVFNAGRATIKHVAGSLADILSLGFQPGAAAASFPAVKQIDATFNESFGFAGGVNPFAQLVSLFPSLESLNLYACSAGAGDHPAITMDLSPLLQNPTMRHFQFGGYRVGWTDYYVEQFANEPLSRWNISHPGVRSIRLESAQEQDSDDMPAEHIVALRKLLNLNSTSYDCLELIKMFSVQQLLAIFDAYAIFPKVAGLRRLSMNINYRTEIDTEELLDSIVRLFARIERTMPHLCALCFGATMYSVDRVAPDTGAFEFARSPEIALLSRFVANAPKQLKELTLCGILQRPDTSVPGGVEQWLLCTLRCLIESKLSCLVVAEAGPDASWPSHFFHRWNANPGSIKDLFKSLPPAATKGNRLMSVKVYTRKREVEFPYAHVSSSMWRDNPVVELRCVLANASAGKTQTLRLRAFPRLSLESARDEALAKRFL